MLGPDSWYTRGIQSLSVMGPDSVGRYRMWFEGEPLVHADIQIGYATAVNETSWTANTEPVFSYASHGQWDDDKVMAPKVLYDGSQYEMWYCGEKRDGFTSIGYATSQEGLNWTRFPGNPVLKRGPGWDANDIYSEDIVREGNLYHMWYGGNASLLNWRIGYAVSPKGLDYNIVSDCDSIHIRVTKPFSYGPDEPGYSFWAEIKMGNTSIDTLLLFNDGLHNDSLAADGIYVNTWRSQTALTYNIDLMLTLSNPADTLNFEMYNAGNVTTAPCVTDLNEQDMNTPAEFSLAQNYPNPFNNSTMIRYQLPKNDFVELSVYNISGQKIATLVNQQQAAGNYQVSWQADNLTSGIYYYKLRTKGYGQVKKMVLLK